MRKEYDFSNAVRGKYAGKRFRILGDVTKPSPKATDETLKKLTLEAKPKSHHLECCGVETLTHLITLKYRRRGSEYIVENVSQEVCGVCGEGYYHAHVVEDIDQRIDELEEDAADIRDAERARAEARQKGFITWEELKRKLDL